MTCSKDSKEFNDTLKRMMDKKPKPHEDMKKGRETKPSPRSGEPRKKR